MNILDAIKSGKRFRLPGWHLWYENRMEHVNKFSCADILRDDWEIESEKIEITKERLEEAWNSLFFPEPFPNQLYKEALPLLVAKLGFKQ